MASEPGVFFTTSHFDGYPAVLVLLEAITAAELREIVIEAWLARAPEKGEDREPLTILAADHRTRAGEWKSALALYPANPAEPNRGWVALMRATCQARLGLHANALATLKEAGAAPQFKDERASLEKQLGL